VPCNNGHGGHSRVVTVVDFQIFGGENMGKRGKTWIETWKNMEKHG